MTMFSAGNAIRQSGYLSGEQPGGHALAAELAAPMDFDKLVPRFEAGDTSTRDIAFYTSAERQAVLDAVEQRGRLSHTEVAICRKASGNLHKAMTGRYDDILQPSAGWNFMVNAAGFLAADRPWAHGLNNLFRTQLTADIPALLNGGYSLQRDASLRQLVAHVSRNPHNAPTIGYYLAARSREGELYQEAHYGSVLATAKQRAEQQIDRYGDSCGLDRVHQERAKRQVQHAKFSAFDHLIGGTTNENGIDGEYESGTLRIEVRASGSPKQAEMREAPDHIIQHELVHASAAQDVAFRRLGLRRGEAGRSINEAFTEFLAQESLGFPGIAFRENGTAEIIGNHYKYELAAMYALGRARPELFASLYCAHYGQVNDISMLGEAVNTFTDNLARIAQR